MADMLYRRKLQGNLDTAIISDTFLVFDNTMFITKQFSMLVLSSTIWQCKDIIYVVHE